MEDDEKKPLSDLVDEQIQKAIESGAFDNLTGIGKPFNFEHDRLVPTENRLAYRIMRDNDIQPEWIMLQKAIETAIAEARRHLRAEAHEYERIQRLFGDKQDVDSILRRIAARDRRDRVQIEFRDLIRQVNKKITEFNLKTPFSHLTRDLIDPEREIAAIFGQN